jgi:hypothetical protein
LIYNHCIILNFSERDKRQSVTGENVEYVVDDDDDDGGWGKLLTRPPGLSGNPTRDIWERVGGIDEGVRILRI